MTNRSTDPRPMRTLLREMRDDIRPRLRTVPANAIVGAAFITWGLRPFLNGLVTVFAIVGSW
jgi:hypothetical protein